MGGVEDDARDVKEAGVVQAVQHGFVQPAPDAALDQIRTRRWTVHFDIPEQDGSDLQTHPLTST